MRVVLPVIIMVLLSSDALDGQTPSVKEVIDTAIEVHGGKRYLDAHFEYDFRAHHYTFRYNHGDFIYERYHSKTETKDILTNEGLKRWISDELVNLSEKDKRKFGNSVNSVHYFAFLPFFLNDAAVIKKYLREEVIKEKSYHKIQVTFEQEGGGDDHDDVYIYWINKEQHTLDYLAYSFHVNGGGVRFREAYNRRKVGGITFQDYVNYKHDKSTDVSVLGQLFNAEKLVALSKIELKHIREISSK